MDTPFSNSSARLPISWKIHELVSLVSDKTRDLLSGDRIPAELGFCDEYDGLLRKYAHCALKDAKVFEIGFGTRAGIMTALVSLGVDAYGVDLDAPVLRGAWRELAEVYRKNGLERVVKSFIRFYAFDWVWRRRLGQEFKRRGRILFMPEGRLLVRWSGTEPKLRIMLEGPDEERLRGWAQELAAAARRDLPG